MQMLEDDEVEDHNSVKESQDTSNDEKIVLVNAP
jgi:hypothetical protein